MLAKFVRVTGSVIAIAVAAMWIAAFFTAVMREYDLAPNGSMDLWHAIRTDVIGALVVGTLVYWPFKALAAGLDPSSETERLPIFGILVVILTAPFSELFQPLPVGHPYSLLLHRLRTSRLLVKCRIGLRRMTRRLVRC